MLLIGLCVFVDRGSNVQILVGLLVALCFALALARTMPYTDPLDNWLAIVCEAQVFFTLACAIVLNNPSQQDNGTLETIMVVGLLVPLIVTVLLIGLQASRRATPLLPVACAIRHAARAWFGCASIMHSACIEPASSQQSPQATSQSPPAR